MRRIVHMEEQDAYTSWRKATIWHRGELGGVKRRTDKRERREGKTQAVSDGTL